MASERINGRVSVWTARSGCRSRRLPPQSCVGSWLFSDESVHQSPPPPHYRQSGFIQSGNRARDTLPYQEQSVMQVLPNSSWYLGSPVIYGEGHFTRVLDSSLHYFLLLSKFIFMDLPVHRTPIAHGICRIPLTTLQTAAHPCNKGPNGRSPK